MWHKTTKEETIARFKVVYSEMRRANDEKAPMTVCVALGKELGELMGILQNEFGMSRDELIRLSDGAVD